MFTPEKIAAMTLAEIVSSIPGADRLLEDYGLEVDGDRLRRRRLADVCRGKGVQPDVLVFLMWASRRLFDSDAAPEADECAAGGASTGEVAPDGCQATLGDGTLNEAFARACHRTHRGLQASGR